MATLTSTRRTAKDSNLMQDCECVRIVRTDGTVYRITNHVSDLTMTTYNNAGTATALGSPVTYQSEQGFDLSAVDVSENTAASIDIEGIIAVTGVTRNDILTGLFDKARIYVFQTDFNSPVEDDEPMFSGYFGEAAVEDGRFVLKFLSLLDVLNINICEIRTRLCRAKLGDARCGVQLSPSAWAATTAYTAGEDRDARLGDVVKPSTQNFYFFKCTTAGTSGGSEPSWDTTLGNTTADGTAVWTTVRANRLELTFASITANALTVSETIPADLDGHFTNGYIEVTSGDGAGQKVRIVSRSGSVFTLERPLLVEPSASDTVRVFAGCTKRLDEDCTTRYNNNYNYQGDPYKPGNLNVRVIGGTK